MTTQIVLKPFDIKTDTLYIKAMIFLLPDIIPIAIFLFVDSRYANLIIGHIAF